MNRCQEKDAAAHDPRADALINELEALKRELKRTRGSWKRSVLNDEIRRVAAELAKHMS